MGGKKHWSMNIYFTEVFVSWAELSWTHVPTFFFVYTHTSEKTPTNGLSKDSDHDNNHGPLIPQRRCWRVNILLCGLESSHSSPGCTPLPWLYIRYFSVQKSEWNGRVSTCFILVLYPRWNFGILNMFFLLLLFENQNSTAECTTRGTSSCGRWFTKAPFNYTINYYPLKPRD